MVLLACELEHPFTKLVAFLDEGRLGSSRPASGLSTVFSLADRSWLQTVPGPVGSPSALTAFLYWGTAPSRAKPQ